MPNWCINQVKITGSEKALNILEEKKFLFQEFLPCPQVLLKTVDGTMNEKKLKENEIKYGYRSWYDWRCANWGTKWDRTNFEQQRLSKNKLTMSFDTAWGIPYKVYEYISKTYDVIIEVVYDIELGNGAGKVIYKNGELTDYEKHKQTDWLRL